MDTKKLVIELIKEKKRFWGKLLYQEYFELFQKVHSNHKLAELISKDLDFSINERQIENIKKKYHKSHNIIESKGIKQQQPNDDFGQTLYNQIYNRENKSGFNLDNL